MTDEHPILAKVRKLLAKAEDPAASVAEAETYTAKATELMASYGLDEALLADRDPSRDPVEDRVVDLQAPYAADKADLLSDLASTLRCRAVLLRTRGGARSVHLFGHRADLARLELLFTSLLLQSTTRLGRTPVPFGEHAAAFRRSWLAGFRMAVVRRLRQVEADATASAAARPATADPGARSTGLVLADRARQVQEAMTERYPHLRTARARQLSGSGMADGWTAGQRADLGGTRLAGAPVGTLGP